MGALAVCKEGLMDMTAIYGILLPFLGTVLGAGCVFFLKKALGLQVQRALTGIDRLCRRSHALCSSGRTDTRNVCRKALQHWYSVLCTGFQCDDGSGCRAGIRF